jgi:hypothetical protein
MSDLQDDDKTPKLFPNRESLRECLTANGKTLCEECGCCEMVGNVCVGCCSPTDEHDR